MNHFTNNQITEFAVNNKLDNLICSAVNFLSGRIKDITNENLKPIILKSNYETFMIINSEGEISPGFEFRGVKYDIELHQFGYWVIE